MPCCCCQGPGVCCQGTTCSQSSACECQSNGGTFQQGRTCLEAFACACPGQPPTQARVCEECPDGCTKGDVCPCKYHPTMRVTVSNVVVTALPITGLSNNAGCGYDLEALNEAHQGIFEGEYVMDFVGIQACDPVYKWVEYSEEGFLVNFFELFTNSLQGNRICMTGASFGTSFIFYHNKAASWFCEENTDESSYEVDLVYPNRPGVVGSATIVIATP